MDREEYEGAVLQHKDRLHSYAVWMLRDPEDARDVGQESLVRLWMHRQEVRPATTGAWLLKTAHNLCVDRLRRRSSRPQVGTEALRTLKDDGQPGPERTVLTVELGKAISRALTALSPRDRSVVLLREVQGMSYNEIAATIDVPTGTLKSVLHRARERLRRELMVAGVRP